MSLYNRHRFPPDSISCAVGLYYRFNLGHRDIGDLSGHVVQIGPKVEPDTISGHLSAVFVVIAHDLKLTCQYHNEHFVQYATSSPRFCPIYRRGSFRDTK